MCFGTVEYYNTVRFVLSFFAYYSEAWLSLWFQIPRHTFQLIRAIPSGPAYGVHAPLASQQGQFWVSTNDGGTSGEVQGKYLAGSVH